MPKRKERENRIFSGEYQGNKMVAGADLNQRPPGYEPDELPDSSTPQHRNLEHLTCQLSGSLFHVSREG